MPENKINGRRQLGDPNVRVIMPLRCPRIRAPRSGGIRGTEAASVEDFEWWRSNLAAQPDFEQRWAAAGLAGLLPQDLDRRLLLEEHCRVWSAVVGRCVRAVQTSDRGLGLVCTQSIRLAAGQRFGRSEGLFGELVKLGEKDYQELCERNFNSLFQGQRALVGVLALANHACWSPLTFSVARDGGLVQLKALKEVRLAPGDELLINYNVAGDLGFICECSHPPSASVVRGSVK
jgi:hypothetical protein